MIAPNVDGGNLGKVVHKKEVRQREEVINIWIANNFSPAGVVLEKHTNLNYTTRVRQRDEMKNTSTVNNFGPAYLIM